MESFATPYSVVFSDGDVDTDKGVIGIHSCLSFKRFQSMIGQKTGLPAAQLSTVFVCKRTVGGVEKRQKLPVNENTNFAIIISQHHSSKERDCYFFVSLKKSKKERKAAKKRVEVDSSEESLSEKAENDDRDLGSSSAAEDKKGIIGNVEDERPAEETKAISGALPLEQSDPCVVKKVVQVNTTAQPSAWKTGSLVQRLASIGGVDDQSEPSDSGKADERLGSGNERNGLPTAAPISSKTPGFQAVSPGVQAVQAKACRSENVTGFVSPTSVLGHPLTAGSSARFSSPPFSGPGDNQGDATYQGAFNLFGTDFQGLCLKDFLEEAAAKGLKSRGFKYCRFCAFFRAQNLASTPFHWCVDDEVVSGFRGPNPAGPIGTRGMKRVAAS